MTLEEITKYAADRGFEYSEWKQPEGRTVCYAKGSEGTCYGTSYGHDIKRSYGSDDARISMRDSLSAHPLMNV